MHFDAIIINLTRFGDLLQTQAAIDDLHLAGFRVGLVCLPNFSTALPLLRNVSKSWTLPGASFLASAWPAACQKLLDFTDRIRNEASPGHIINLTPTAPARLLTRLLNKDGQASVLGFGMDELGYGINHSAWASYLTVAAGSRNHAALNISDMFRMIAAPLSKQQRGSGALALPEASLTQWATNFLVLPPGVPAPQGFVAFQPGASEERRRWPVEHFARLGARLWEKERLCPVLTGSDGERKLAEEYAALATTPFIDAIGKTSIPELAALLRQCRLLVSNDTGTLHLAAGLNVPSLSFFMATAQPWDTGPALANCCCLEPALDCHPCSFGTVCQKNEICRTQIKPETAAALISGFLKDGSWASGVDSAMDNECRIWVTKLFRDGLQLIEPLNHFQNTDARLWLAWQRRFWANMLNHLDLGCNSVSVQDSCKDLPLPANAADMAHDLRTAADLLDAVAQFSILALKNPGAGKIFLKNCERLQGHLDSWQTMRSLGAFWREFSQTRSQDLAAFSWQSKTIASHVRSLSDALQK